MRFDLDAALSLGCLIVVIGMTVFMAGGFFFGGGSAVGVKASPVIPWQSVRTVPSPIKHGFYESRQADSGL